MEFGIEKCAMRENQKYFEKLEADMIKQRFKKWENYLRRTRKLLGSNLIKGINTTSCKILGIIPKMDNGLLWQMYQETRKLMMVAHALHLRDDIDYLCQENKDKKDLSALK